MVFYCVNVNRNVFILDKQFPDGAMSAREREGENDIESETVAVYLCANEMYRKVLCICADEIVSGSVFEFVSFFS